MWPKEEIPNKDMLFYRIHQSFFRKGKLTSGVFIDRNGGMSVEWDKFSTPKQAQQRAKKPNENGIIRLNCGKVRQIIPREAKNPLKVEHDPIQENRSHTLVIGNKDPEVRMQLKRISNWVIPCP
jgi:hypothetical protein